MLPAVGGILQSTAAFVGAYDAIPDLVHLYEIARRGVSSYEGSLVRLRRDSDNAESDFGYDDDGLLDTAAITTWLGGASGFVVTVYDQVGSNNPTQATAGNQPTYVSSGQNGKPVTRHITSDTVAVSFSSTLSQPVSYYAGAKLSDTSSSRFIFDSPSGNRMALFSLSGTMTIFSGSLLSGNASDTDPHLYSVLFNNTASQFWRDGTSENSGTSGTQNANAITLGGSLIGDIFVIAVADPSHDDTERGAMQTAINDFWSVF